MKHRLFLVLLTASLLAILSSCHTSAPSYDYQALAQASVRLGVDIGLKDNHALYLEAAQWIGTPYRAGGSSRRGTDCSGFVWQMYRKVYGKELSRSSEQQMKESRKVSRRKLREGDLVFFGTTRRKRRVSHVGIYLKEGKFVHASTSRGVIVSSLDEPYYEERWIKGGRY